MPYHVRADIEDPQRTVSYVDQDADDNPVARLVDASKYVIQTMTADFAEERIDVYICEAYEKDESEVEPLEPIVYVKLIEHTYTSFMMRLSDGLIENMTPQLLLDFIVEQGLLDGQFPDE